ncbi:MAG: 4-hydroxy-3-methylbut-2-enyl diphosphate reductase [Clostridia bacterium]|nr:4-hydroxy-3-methylbut-2-enyl diphosphate reductase [Clostridia bacterium]
MKITVAKHSGFCMGVKKAVETALAVKDKNIYILGELIHNPAVISHLKNNGIKKIDSLDEIDSGTVIIRSHGVGKDVYSKIFEKGLNLVDATCSYVKNIQKKAEKYYKKGYQIVIIGDKNHPEVIGINGWCDNSAIICDEDCEKIDLSGYSKICVLAQTTFSPEKFENILKYIVDDKKIVEVFNTICYTTVMRQKEAIQLARENDCIIVIGGKSSSNTQKLKSLCKNECDNVFSIEYPNEIDIVDIINKYNKVAIVAGASTPNELIKEVYLSMEQVVKANLDENSASTEKETVNLNVEDVVKTETEEKTVLQTEENQVNEVIEKQQEVKTESAVEVQEQKEIAEKETKKESVITSMDQAIKEMDKKETHFKKGQVVKAIIALIEDEGLSLAIGTRKSDYFLSKDHIEIDSQYDKTKFNVGDVIDVVVTNTSPLQLSRKQFFINQRDDALIEEFKNGKLFRIKINGFNKGGLVSKFGSFNVFIPSSLIRMGYVKPEEFERYNDKELKVKLIEVKGKTIIASAKDVILEERQKRDEARNAAIKAFFESIEVGQVVEGKVVRFTEFGAFVNVNGFDCLAHISDLAWTNVKKAEDVLEKNNTYEFVILKIDDEKQHISLGYKQLQPRPWELAAEKYPEGSIINGKVVRIAPFGAFVEVEPGIDGLVHVSQITHEWIENPATALKVGDEIEAKVIEVKPDAQKLTLSIKALLPEPEGGIVKPSKKTDGDNEKKTVAARKPRIKRDPSELREWSSNDNAAASIGDLINIELETKENEE